MQIAQRFCLSLLHAISPLISFGLVLGSASPIVAQGMALTGALDVSANGAATYSVAINVPPGTAGIAPKLSLEYDSHDGNGLLGVGWSLVGLPSIGRCAQTIAQDGTRGSVKYDANDRFCLDGERLVAISGAYGADGTEYRTEVESLTRVISRSAAGTGPAWFEVRTKSGHRMEFGNTPDSRILAQGKTSAGLWAVNKVSDTKGNAYIVSYVNDLANGQAYPTRIDYSANSASGVAPYNSVRFAYDTTRPDKTPTYRAGSLQKRTVRLASVQTYAGSALVSDYRLAYQVSTSTGRSQLASVELCNGTGACLPATTFTWQQGTDAYSVVSNVSGLNGQQTNTIPYVADFDGDGLSDIMWDSVSSATDTKSSGTRVLWKNTGNGNFSATSNMDGANGTLVDHIPIIADYNGDGRADIWWYKFGVAPFGVPVALAGPTSKWISTASGTRTISVGTSVVPSNASPYGGTPYGGINFNGDHRADLVWSDGPVWSLQPDGTTTTTTTSGPASFLILKGDFDGNGFTDFVTSLSPLIANAPMFYYATPGGVYELGAPIANAPTFQRFALDTNGDGNSDLLFYSPASLSDLRSAGIRVAWMSKGDRTYSAISNPGATDGSVVGYLPYVGDFNFDGLHDVLWDKADPSGRSLGDRIVWYSKGDGTFNVVQNFAGQNGTLSGYAPVLGDFNGDGRTDILWDSRSADDARSKGTRVLWLSSPSFHDLLKTVTNGLEVAKTFTYAALTNPAVYLKENTASDPMVDVQFPLRVVSRIDEADGIGGVSGRTFSYEGAKIDGHGRGFLGFHKLIGTDIKRGTVETTTYLQNFPFGGMTASHVRKRGTVTLRSSVNSFIERNLGGTRRFALLQQQVESGSDLDGSLLPTVTTSYDYDSLGNATQIITSASDGHGKKITNTYLNNTTEWLLGRITSVSVESTSPDELPPQPPCSLPWGGTLSSGQGVTAYSASAPPLGQSCSTIAQTRTCTSGTLSGSNTHQSCAEQACSLPWGETLGSGVSVTAYSAATPPSGQPCTAIDETRTCTNGVLSGSYAQRTCTAQACSLPWGGTINSGQSATAYSASAAPVGQLCSAIQQTRTCSNGVLSGSYVHNSCTASQACALPWGGSIAHGGTATAYQSSGGCGGTCTSQVRTCTNGSLSGAYGVQSCSTACSSCTANQNVNWSVASASCSQSSGTLLGHGSTRSITDSTAPATGSVTIACSNGTLNKSAATCTTQGTWVEQENKCTTYSLSLCTTLTTPCTIGAMCQTNSRDTTCGSIFTGTRYKKYVCQ